ncbi:hypothetical protein BsWGS_07650 [Bradybaena similaris]
MTMASLPLDSVDIFDDFDDADSLEVAYCKLVSDKQYEEDTRSETDKALGELCLYLDQNPELYSRVLRKRKQEEMENAGVFSYVKSKMMSLLHGEQYPQCLVSASECVQQTNALKAGMCKTFQLSQELKGNVNRHSARIAAKRQAKMCGMKNSSDRPLVVSEKAARGKRNNALISPGKSASSDVTASKVDLATKSGAQSADVTVINSSSSVVPVPAIVVSQIHEDSTSKGNYDFETMDVGLQKGHQQKASAGEGIKAQPALLEVSSNISVTPPPAPPLPAHFISSAVPMHSSQKAQQTPARARKNPSPRSHKKNQSPESHKKNQSPKSHKKNQSPESHKKNQSPKPHRKNQSPDSHRTARSPKPRTPKNVELPARNEGRSSPRVRHNRVSVGEVPTRAGSLQNLSTLSGGSGTSSLSSPFLTPDIPNRFKAHKRTQSNSSLSSLSSYGSCSSLNSEILLFNPISRLKATPVIRSPGGTPLRQMKDALLSEPIHKALYTAIRSRFRNVKTPSPSSGNASINANNSSVLNSTFSP